MSAKDGCDLGRTSATRGSLAAATSVFLAAALEAATLGDFPDGRALAGACLMLAGVALAWRRPTTVPASVARKLPAGEPALPQRSLTRSR